MLLATASDCTGSFVLGLEGHSENRFSHNVAHIASQINLTYQTYDSAISLRSALELPAGPAILLRLLTPKVEVTGWGGDMWRDL